MNFKIVFTLQTKQIIESAKMDYTKYSDWQINCLIAKRLNILSDMHICNERKTITRHCENGKTLKKIVQVDYCNNPADAWPIILESEISIIRDASTSHVWEAMPKGWWTMNGFESSTDINLCHIDKNPLRAAMIVFLMMKE